jgi:hypothetical protein
MKVPRSPALSTYLLRQGSEGGPASSFTVERAWRRPYEIEAMQKRVADAMSGFRSRGDYPLAVSTA